jgi:hypothetical protein
VHGRAFESFLFFWGVNGGVVYGSGFKILDFWGVNGGVVHGRGSESLTFGGQWWCSAWSWGSESLTKIDFMAFGVIFLHN